MPQNPHPYSTGMQTDWQSHRGEAKTGSLEKTDRKIRFWVRLRDPVSVKKVKEWLKKLPSTNPISLQAHIHTHT